VFGCSSRAGGGPLWYRYWPGARHWRRYRQKSGPSSRCGRSPCERMLKRWEAWLERWGKENKIF
jgi:hypothetical protein